MCYICFLTTVPSFCIMGDSYIHLGHERLKANMGTDLSLDAHGPLVWKWQHILGWPSPYLLLVPMCQIFSHYSASFSDNCTASKCSYFQCSLCLNSKCIVDHGHVGLEMKRIVGTLLSWGSGKQLCKINKNRKSTLQYFTVILRAHHQLQLQLLLLFI